MKCKHVTNLLLMAGIAALVAACGGGGGGGSSALPVTVTSAKNPVLVGGSTTVTANFSNYTSTARFGSSAIKVGSMVNFSVTGPGVLSSATNVQAGGAATVSVSSPQTAKVTVSAGSGNFAGSTTVSFIPLPATASVVISPPAAIAGLSALSCDVRSDVPVTFSGYSTLPAVLPAVSPVTGSNNVTLLTPALVSASGVNVTSASILFKLTFAVPVNALAVPNFSIDQASVIASLANPATAIIPAPVLGLAPTYYDGTGKVLFPK